jgi:multidrug transporter EmrE-like cation transporter
VFENVGFLNEQVLDTSVGSFSVRQMCFFLVFGLLAYVVSLVFVDLVLKVMFVGVAVALWNVRTYPLKFICSTCVNAISFSQT